jgi:hypothetical protein
MGAIRLLRVPNSQPPQSMKWEVYKAKYDVKCFLSHKHFIPNFSSSKLFPTINTKIYRMSSVRAMPDSNAGRPDSRPRRRPAILGIPSKNSTPSPQPLISNKYEGQLTTKKTSPTSRTGAPQCIPSKLLRRSAPGYQGPNDAISPSQRHGHWRMVDTCVSH